MKEEDKERFATALFTLAEVLGEPLSQARIGGYFLALQEFDIADVELALNQGLKTYRFFPKPTDLIEAIRGRAEDAAALAWYTFLEATTDGGYASIQFYDHSMARAMAEVFGGWIAACQTLNTASDEMAAHYKRSFVTQYMRGSNVPVLLYWRGQMERSWREGSAKALPAGITGTVLIATAGRLACLRVPFDTQTGALLPAGQQALDAGPDAAIQYALTVGPQASLRPVSLPSLPGATVPDEAASQQEIKEVLQAISWLAQTSGLPEVDHVGR